MAERNNRDAEIFTVLRCIVNHDVYHSLIDIASHNQPLNKNYDKYGL